jgi:hypothetical protein
MTEPSTPPPCDAAKRVARDDGGTRPPAAVRRLAPLPIDQWVSEQRWEGPVELPPSPEPACFRPTPGHAMALWATGDAAATAAMIRRVVRLKRARNGVFQNADLLRVVLLGNIGPSTFAQLSATCRTFRSFLLRSGEVGVLRSAALYTNGLCTEEMRGFLCVPRYTLSRLPARNDVLFGPLYGAAAVDALLAPREGLDGCGRLLQRRRDWGRQIHLEDHVPVRKRKRQAPKPRWECEDLRHRSVE